MHQYPFTQTSNAEMELRRFTTLQIEQYERSEANFLLKILFSAPLTLSPITPKPGEMAVG
jgi:hypothetical protein